MIDRELWPQASKWYLLDNLYKELKACTTQYQLQIERLAITDEIRFSLVKWNRDPSISPATKREVLGVYTDIDEVIGVMKLLVVNEKEKLNERRA